MAPLACLEYAFGANGILVGARAIGYALAGMALMGNGGR